MKDEKFDLMTNVIRILQQNNSNMESIIEIIGTYDENLTVEQKADILDNVLKNKGRRESDVKHKCFEQESLREQLRSISMPDFSL